MRTLPMAVTLAAMSTLAASSARAAESAEPSASGSVQSANDSFPRTALQLGAGPSGFASTWRGDGGAGGAGRLGLLLFGVIAPDVLVRLNYAGVDDRMLTYLSLGLTGYVPLRAVRPYARIAVVHQHEESRAAIEDGPAHAAMGVGPGIRHRAGFAGALGAEVPLRRQGRTTFALGGDVTATQFPDDRGPSTYVGGTLWLTLHHAL